MGAVAERELFWRKEFRMDRLGGGGCCGNVERSFKRQSDWRQADLRTAGLVAQFEREMLGTERRARERGNRKVELDSVFVDV